VGGLITWLIVRLVVWRVPRLAGGFIARLELGFAEGEGSPPQGPLESWRNDRVFGLVTGLAFVLTAGLGFGLNDGLESGLMNGLAYGLTLGLVYGIVSSVTWSTTLAWRLQLQRSGRVPNVSLMPFLEDARERNVLRTAGAVYQFRHATLQDQLAGQTTASRKHSRGLLSGWLKRGRWGLSGSA
jgi:hypothetical protein